MHRIDNSTAMHTLTAPRPPGTPGYWTGGDPSTGQPATIFDCDWLNSVQEEISYVIEQAGLTLLKSDRTQLYQALQRFIVAAQLRVRLLADIDYYLAPPPAGNDANDGLSPSTAWATLDHAYNWIRDRLDLNGHTARIYLANGYYDGGDFGFPVVGPYPQIIGNVADPSQVTISGNSAAAISTLDGAGVIVDSVTVRSIGTLTGASAGLLAGVGGIIGFQNVRFDTCLGYHQYAYQGGDISAIGAYEVVGAARAHQLAQNASYITNRGFGVTITGNPHFADYWAGANSAGNVDSVGANFVGTATGVRYVCSLGGIITVGGAGTGFLPGDTAGDSTTGYYG